MTGIYCIRVDNCITYIGQSVNISNRINSHNISIYTEKKNKYLLLKSALFHGHSISFYLLEETDEKNLDEREQFWIRLIQPPLNSNFNHLNGKNIDSNTFFNHIYSTSGWVEGWRKIGEIKKIDGHFHFDNRIN